MFLFGSKSILGIDLGTSGIKITELSARSGGRFELKNYGILDFIPIAIPQPAQGGAEPSTSKDKSSPKLDDQLFISGLKDLLNKGEFSTKDTIASISSFLTFTTIIELPYLSEKDLGKAIPFEARKYIPIPLQEVILDWSIINVKQAGDHTNVEVFLVAVPKDQAERYKNIFVSAGLNLKALELENIALSRVLNQDGLSPLVIVNLGGRSTSITVFDNNFEKISRNYEVGGVELTKALSETLVISFEEAEKIKKTEGLKIGSSSFTVISQIVDLIVLEVKKVVSNYEESKKIKINKIVLAGGQASMPGLKDYFTEKLGKEVLLSDPFKNVSYDKVLEPALKSLSPSLSVAVGLAMRKI